MFIILIIVVNSVRKSEYTIRVCALEVWSLGVCQSMVGKGCTCEVHVGSCITRLKY